MSFVSIIICICILIVIGSGARQQYEYYIIVNGNKIDTVMCMDEQLTL